MVRDEADVLLTFWISLCLCFYMCVCVHAYTLDICNIAAVCNRISCGKAESADFQHVL